MTKPADRDSQAPEKLIDEAIRRKRDGQKTLLADLNALEAAVLAEIEAFDQRAISLAPEAPTVDALANFAGGTQFPKIAQDNPQPAAGTGNAPQSKPAAGSPGAPPDGISLLQHLRQQAQARQEDAAARQRDLSEVSKELDQRLRRVFSYCHELVQQLNIVKPAIERRYSMLGNIDFAGLQWHEGFVDYRTRPHSSGSGATYEQVTVSCSLRAPHKLTVERDGISADSFRKALFDNGVVFTCDEVRNSRHLLQSATFSITAEVKVNLRWRADVEQGVVVLETRNLERFGKRDYLLAPESVSMAMLDQFARLLLGQPNQFRDFYRH